VPRHEHRDPNPLVARRPSEREREKKGDAHVVHVVRDDRAVLDHRGVLWLQRVAGNAAVGDRLRAVQRKWQDTGAPDSYQWDALMTGVQWYRAKHTPDALRLTIRSENQLLAGHAGDNALLAKVAAKQGAPDTRANWLAAFGGKETSVPPVEGEVVATPPSAAPPHLTDLDAILASYLTAFTDGVKANTFKESVRLPIETLRAKGVDVGSVVATVKNLGMKVAEESKMYCIENVLHGLVMGYDQTAPFLPYIVASLESPTDKTRQIAEAVAYAKEKNRWDPTTFEVVAKGIVFGLTRSYPRGFASADQFGEFCTDYRGLLGPYGTDLFVQGSAAIDIAGPVKDIDMAILHDDNGFRRALAEKCVEKSKVIWRILVLLKKKAGNWNGPSISNADIDDAMIFINNGGQGKDIDGNDQKLWNAPMSSIQYCFDRGIWKHSDFLTKPQKKERDRLDTKWMAGLNVLHTMDMSIVRRGGEFDKPPYLPFV
jgi:hypothetical protein